MTESELNEAKRNIIADCMRRRFESMATDILKTESSFEEIDRKLDPMLRRHFDDLGKVYDYYAGESKPGVEFEDKHYTAEKVGLICYILQENFIKEASTILAKAKSIEEADKKLSGSFDILIAQKAAVRQHYHVAEPEDDS